MTRAKIVPSAIVLAFALSSCASTEIPPPVETPVVDAGPSDIAGAILLAQSQREAGELNAATATLSQLVLIAPDDPRVLGEYGKTLVDKGDITDALAFLQRAIELDQGEWTYHSAQGVAFSQARDYRSAGIAFSRALSLSPDQPTVLNNYALSQMQAGNLDQAELLLMRAAASGPASPRIIQNLAMVRELKASQVAPVPVNDAPAAPPAAVADTGQAPDAVQAVPAPGAVEVAEIESVPSPVPQVSAESAPLTEAPANVPAAQRIPGVAEGTVRVQALPARETESESAPAGESAVVSVTEPQASEIWLPATGPIYLQVGSFSSAENAGRFAEQLSDLNPSVTLFHAGERALHRVSVGPYADRAAARLALASLGLLGVHDVQALSSLGGGSGTAAPAAEPTADPAPAPQTIPAESGDETPGLRFSENR